MIVRVDAPRGGLALIVRVTSEFDDCSVIAASKMSAAPSAPSHSFRPAPGSARGRTAICMTGLPRALLTHFDRSNVFFDHDGSTTVSKRIIAHDWAWAGVRRLPFADNVMASALHRNVLDVLAYDGFDLFVLQHGPVTNVSNSSQLLEVSTSSPPSVGGYSALEPRSVNAEGKPTACTCCVVASRATSNSTCRIRDGVTTGPAKWWDSKKRCAGT